MSRRALVLGAFLCLASWVVGGEAHAYPQWQFSSGTSRCSQCHFSPSGGGLLTGYGRDAAGEELSTWEGAGAFLHGAIDLPSRLNLGGEFRGAVLSHDVGNSEGSKQAIFPMQADLYARFGVTDAISVAATVGMRGQIRSSGGPVDEENYQPQPQSRFISREHYAMWRPAAMGPYARAGRFYAPFGLRLAEHTTYIRRDTGFNLLQETYNVSAGILRSEWEVHVTGFLPDFWRKTGLRERGAVAMGEMRLLDKYAVGASGRVGLGDDANRFTGGLFGKAWMEKAKLLFMAEADVERLLSAGTAIASNRLIGLLGATFFPFKGLWLSAYVERSQTDLRVRDTATDALSGQINWFPYPHFELSLLGRAQSPRGQETARTGLLQLHYYL